MWFMSQTLWHSYCRYDQKCNELHEIKDQTPILVLDCDPSIAGCEEILNNSKVLRIRASLTGGAMQVNDVKPALIEVWKGSRRLDLGSYIPLAFQPSEALDSESKTLSNGSPRVIDVVFIIKNDAGVFDRFLVGSRDAARCGASVHFNSWLGETGKYRLKIQCTGTGMKTVTLDATLTIAPDRWSSTLEAAR